MKTTRYIFGLIAIALVAVFVFPPELALKILHSKTLFMALMPMAGTVTLTYQFFQQNNLQQGTTPPTAAQAQNEGMLNVTLNWADADTQAVITHNWNLSAAEQAALLPITDVMPFQSNTGTTIPILAAQGTNSVTIGKPANAGSGGTYFVWMLRPSSLIR